jgi:hypothetical protein
VMITLGHKLGLQEMNLWIWLLITTVQSLTPWCILDRST